MFLFDLRLPACASTMAVVLLVASLQVDAFAGEFEGRYRIGGALCSVKPERMSFEIRCPAPLGVTRVFFDRSDQKGRSVFVSEETAKGSTQLVFDTSEFDAGTLTLADGKILHVKRVLR